MKNRCITFCLALLALLAMGPAIHAYTFTNINEDLTVDALVFTSSTKALAYLRGVGWTNKIKVEVFDPLAPWVVSSMILAGPAALISGAYWAVLGGAQVTRAALKKKFVAIAHEKMPPTDSVSYPWQDLRKKFKGIEKIRLFIFDSATGTLLASGKFGIQADIFFYGIGNITALYIFKDKKGAEHIATETEGIENNWQLVKPWEKQ